MYAYLRRLGGKVAESLILPPSSSSVLLRFRYFWHWPDGNMTSAVRGAGRCWTRFLWGFLQAGLRMPLFCGAFCIKVAECMHIYVGLAAR